ncbi:MAG: 3-dehydroquinate synthase [Planctomycetes bacterium]|nr:3-dehydroquinate synthase [Planctomycetota bacterium]
MIWPSYGRGILSALLPRELAESAPQPTAVFALIDCGALEVTREALERAEAALDCPLHRIDWQPTEQLKSLGEAERLARRMVGLGIDRSAMVVGVGGGITTDMAGFLAAVLLRGLRWGAVPTTLLGMADAALGGKTAVNLPEGKNLVGAFHQPCFVLADIDTLVTLPPREWRCGLGEILKAALIDGSELMPALERAAPEDLDFAGSTALELAAGAGRVKMRIAEADPTESAERKLLNLGHTFGHALETAAAGDPAIPQGLAHGEAVALGLRCAARMAEEMEVARAGLRRQVVELSGKLGLPSAYPGVLPDVAALTVLLGRDKKAHGGSLDLVLPAEPGSCLIVRGIAPAAVAEVIHQELG